MDEIDPTKQAPQRPAARQWTLTAHRSLGPTGFVVLMALLCGVSFVAGLVFLLIGAWPVTGFLGLDVLLIWAAFKFNYRAGRCYETVELAPDMLTVTRVQPSGRRATFTFNPYWVRLHLDEGADGRTRLRLAHHGRELIFAAGLNDEERRGFATALSTALGEARMGRA
jgi:uncharacterized membrane protein